MNPAVDSAVFSGAGNIPRGYLLRVPPGTAGAFEQRLAQIASDARVVAVTPSRARHASGTSVRSATRSRGSDGKITATAYRTHTVTRGQTLSNIAEKYRVPLTKLRSANRLRGNTVKAGQVLKIPAG